MNQDLFFYTKRLNRFFSTYHMILYISIAGIFMAIIMYLLFTIYMTATTPPVSTTQITTTFNEQAVTEIQGLHSQTDTIEDIETPTGRINPFAE